MPRIAIFAPHFAEYATRLALALSQRAEVLLFLEHHNRVNECEDELIEHLRKRVTLVEFRQRGRIRRQLGRILVPLVCRLFRPDIIHVQEQPDPLTVSIVRLMGRRAKNILTVHDPKPHTGNDQDYAVRMDNNLRFLRGVADGYHVHGSFCERLLRESGWNDKPILSTMHGVILVPSPATVRNPDPGRFLLFGRMEAYKGVDLAIEAAAILRARGVSFKLVLAGRGSELERLRTDLQGHDDVEIVAEFLKPERAIQEFQRAAWVVVPYRDATQSGVVSAAFGNARPVIATRTGGLVDAVEDQRTGLLVAPNNPQELADALFKVLQDDGLQARLTSNIREISATTFNWNVIAVALSNFYKTVRVKPFPQR